MGGNCATSVAHHPSYWGRCSVCLPHLETEAPGALPDSHCSEFGALEDRQLASPGQRETGALGFACIQEAPLTPPQVETPRSYPEKSDFPV